MRGEFRVFVLNYPLSIRIYKEKIMTFVEIIDDNNLVEDSTKDMLL